MVENVTTINIRDAYLADIDKIVELGLDMCNHYGLAADQDSVAQMAMYLYVSDTLLVAERNGEIIGYIGYIVNTNWWNSAKTATIVSVHVDPDKTSGTVLPRLLLRAECAAGEAGADGMVLGLGVDLGQMQTAAGRLFKRYGYKPTEPVLRKDF